MAEHGIWRNKHQAPHHPATHCKPLGRRQPHGRSAGNPTTVPAINSGRTPGLRAGDGDEPARATTTKALPTTSPAAVRCGFLFLVTPTIAGPFLSHAPWAIASDPFAVLPAATVQGRERERERSARARPEAAVRRGGPAPHVPLLFRANRVSICCRLLQLPAMHNAVYLLRANFSFYAFNFFLNFDIVVFSFLFDKHCSTIE